LGGQLREDDLLHYFDEGHGSLTIFGDTDVSSVYRKLANYFGLEFYEQGVRVYHAKGDPVIKTRVTTEHRIIASQPRAPLTMSGIGFQIRKDHKLATPILNATDTSFLQHELKGGEVIDTISGRNIVLGAVFQGMNNARMSIFGGVDLCSNAYQSSNEIFCREVLDWTINKKGVLRTSQITHFETARPQAKGYLEAEYSVNDTIHYSIDIEEWDGQAWRPFTSPGVYLEFVMLDPYVRRFLESKAGTYSLTFTAPDKYGVFQFKTYFLQPGYSWVNTATLVPVRPLRHNEYERFLTAAFPYYSSVLSVLVGFVVFSFFFLFHKD
jgi:oligosaccharyltransferase complex subunit beta